MQKLLLAVLLISLLAIATARPNYHRQGRRKGDACRLNCLYDAIMCESPCRLFFRSRLSYLTCCKDCRRDRVGCFVGCKTIELPGAKTETQPEAGSLGKGEATEGKGGRGGKAGKAGSASDAAESGSESNRASNRTHDDDDDDDDNDDLHDAED